MDDLSSTFGRMSVRGRGYGREPERLREPTGTMHRKLTIEAVENVPRFTNIPPTMRTFFQKKLALAKSISEETDGRFPHDMKYYNDRFDKLGMPKYSEDTSFVDLAKWFVAFEVNEEDMKWAGEMLDALNTYSNFVFFMVAFWLMKESTSSVSKDLSEGKLVTVEKLFEKAGFHGTFAGKENEDFLFSRGFNVCMLLKYPSDVDEVDFIIIALFGKPGKSGDGLPFPNLDALLRTLKRAAELILAVSPTNVPMPKLDSIQKGELADLAFSKDGSEVKAVMYRTHINLYPILYKLYYGTIWDEKYEDLDKVKAAKEKEAAKDISKRSKLEERYEWVVQDETPREKDAKSAREKARKAAKNEAANKDDSVIVPPPHLNRPRISLPVHPGIPPSIHLAPKTSMYEEDDDDEVVVPSDLYIPPPQPRHTGPSSSSMSVPPSYQPTLAETVELKGGIGLIVYVRREPSNPFWLIVYADDEDLGVIKIGRSKLNKDKPDFTGTAALKYERVVNYPDVLRKGCRGFQVYVDDNYILRYRSVNVSPVLG
jgi:hypothetical protein